MTALEMAGVLVLLLGVLLALAKVCRDLLIMRQLRAVLSDCSPEERVRICLHLACALHGTGWSPGVSGQAAGEEVPHQ